MNDSDTSSEKRIRKRQRIHVLVADRNAHFRETVRRVLAELGRCFVSGEASTVAEVISQIDESRVDLLLLDIDMVTGDRLAGLQRLARKWPDLKVAVLLTYDAPEYRQEVQRHGGHFGVAKESIEEQLPTVLNSVLTEYEAPVEDPALQEED